MKIRLTLKFAIGIFLVAGVGVLLFAYLSYSKISDYFKQNLLYHISVELESDAKDIYNMINIIKKDVKNISASEEIQGYMRAYKNPYHYDEQENINLEDWENRIKKMFTTYIEQHESYFQLRFIGIDNKGKELIRCENKDDTVFFTKNENLQSKGNKKYFKDTIVLNKDEVYISKINLNKEFGNISLPMIPTIRVAMPIYNGEEVFGIVIINANTDKLFNLEKYRNIKGKNTFLINKDGYYLFHNDVDKTFGFEFKKSFNIKNEFGLDELLDGNVEKMGYYTDNEIAFFAQKIDLGKGFIVLARSATNIFLKEQSEEYKQTTLLYIVLVTLMIAIFSAVLTKFLTATILKLTKRAKLVADTMGEKDIDFVDIKSNDEIGELSKSMGIMVDNLVASKKELSKFASSLEEEVKKRTKEQEILLSVFDKGDAVLFKWKNDDKLTVSSVSNSVKKLFGYDRQDFLESKIYYEKCIHKDDLERFNIEVNDAVNEGKYFFEHEPYRIYTQNNKVKWVHENTIIIRDEFSGEVTDFLGYIIDITQLKELNDKLELKVEKGIEEIRSKDELLAHQSKLAAMGEMIGAIAHQWRQPLNALAVQVQFMEDDFEDGLIDKEYLNEYKKENMKLINFMSKTIDDFRNFFRVDKEKVLFDINEKISETINILSPQLDSHKIELELKGEGFDTLGFPSEFQQVVLNIINNAKDAISEKEKEDGKITVEIDKLDEKYGIVQISDNAGGIPDDILNRVFDPYFTTKDQGKGTGLGLYMSKMIIEQNLDGELSVTNDNDGAKFTIKLKIEQS
jgi:PAS domain S-box-containing protein